jgi:hypothetical protein
MFIEILDAVRAEIVQSEHMQLFPRWVLRDGNLLIGPYHSAEEHEQHVTQTIGSTDWLWSGSDELRFDKQTLKLQSCWFQAPETNLASGLQLEPWLTAEVKHGLLRLAGAQAFQLEPTEVRWMDANGEMLTCVSERALEDAQDRLRLRVSQDVDLLCADGRLCGWSLLHPARYLVSAWEDSYSEEPGRQLATLLHEYFTLVASSHIEQMEDKDPDMLNALIDLYKRVKSDRDSSEQCKVLQACVGDVLDMFYEYKVDEI